MNPLDTLLQKVRSNVGNTASRLFGQAQSFVQNNPTPAGYLNQKLQQSSAPSFIKQNPLPAGFAVKKFQEATRPVVNTMTKFQAPLESKVQPFINSLPVSKQVKEALPNAFPILQAPFMVGENVRQAGRLLSLKPQPLDVASVALPMVAGKIQALKSPQANKAVALLRGKLTTEDVNTIGKFAEVVETKGGKVALDPELGNTIHSLAKNVFGKDAENWSNQKLKNVFDLVLGKIGQGENIAGLGLQAKPLRSVAEAEKALENIPEGKVRGFVESVKESSEVLGKVKKQVTGGYIPKRNTQLMGEAQALLQEGASIDLKNTQDIDKKITATMQEAISQQKKNPQLAANLFNNLSEKGTELGRGVQAFSLLNKMSPDAIALSAAGKIKAYNRTATRKIPELNGEQVSMISKQVDAIKKLAEGSRERNIAVNNLSNTINDFIPSSFADKVITTWKAGLLTSLRTSERNIFGNTVHGMVEAVKDLPASLADRLMAGVTGKRTLTSTFQGAGEMYSKKTGQQISDVLRLGYDASEDISKFDHKRITWSNTPVQQALKKYTDIVFRSLGAQDKPFYNSAFKRSLYSQAGAEAINIGQEGNRKVIQNLVENPTDQMIKTAISDANVATFKDKNSASAIASAIKREMAKVTIGGIELGKIASEVMMPFTGVPTSILGQIANYSPIGLLKGIINTGKVMSQNVPELQRQAAHEIGRGVIGTGVFGLGSYLASKGLITGQPKDATEQRQWDLENKPRNSIMINGKWRSLNSVGPEAVVFLAGAKLNEELNNPEGSVGGYAGTLGKDYLDQSFVTGLQQPVNAITDPARYGKSYVGNMMASGMPNIVKDVAKSQDSSQREANTITDYAKLATPFVRNTLTEKRDALGNVMKQEPTGVGVFFDLFNSKTPVDNAVVNELSRLQKEGQSATPSKLTPNQTILKQKVKLTFDQLNQLEKGVGEALQPRLQVLVTSPNYQKLDDEQKAQAIDKVVQATRSQYKNINAGAINAGLKENTLPQGEMIPIVNKNGNVTLVDTSFQPEKPKLTGQAELDKKLLSSYYSDITKKSNDIVDLYEVGKLTAQEANTKLTELKALKSSGGSKKSPKVSMAKIKMPKLKKLKSYKPKKIRFKKIKLPKLKALKAQRV